jgi:hypothetical protein
MNRVFPSRLAPTLTIEEMAEARTAREWARWVERVENALSATPDSIRESRRRRGLLKYYYDEVIPLSLFAQSYAPRSPEVRVQWLYERRKGKQNNFDGVLIDAYSESGQVKRIEVSMAVAGYSASLRREELNRNGRVSGIGEVRVSTRGDARHISAPTIAVRRELPQAHSLALIRDCIRSKAANRYKGIDFLVVGFDDIPFLKDDLSMVRDWCCRYVLPRWLPPFAQLWLIGTYKRLCVHVDLLRYRDL